MSHFPQSAHAPTARTRLRAPAAGVRKVVLASSGSVYPSNRPAIDGRPAASFTEDDKPDGRGFYGLSKYVTELYAEAFHAAFGLEFVALRLGVMYGPRLRMGLSSRFLLSVLDDVDRGREPVIDADPDSALDWVSVQDAAECFVRALDVGPLNVPINVSTGHASRLEDVLTTLLDLYRVAIPIRWTGAQPTGTVSKARYYDNSRAHELLGFAPSADLRPGLQSYLDWRAALREV